MPTRVPPEGPALTPASDGASHHCAERLIRWPLPTNYGDEIAPARNYLHASGEERNWTPNMGRMRRKGDLPEKICATCGRPFAWRHKWAENWDEVRYCSERCRRNRPKGGDHNGGTAMIQPAAAGPTALEICPGGVPRRGATQPAALRPSRAGTIARASALAHGG